MLTLLTILACAPEPQDSTTETASASTDAPTGGPQVYVWEYDCDEEAPAWDLPAGTIIGMQHLTILNGSTIARGEEVTIEVGQGAPVIDGEEPGADCGTGYQTAGRLVVTYLPA